VARLVWTEPALADLDAIAEYVAIDKPDAAAVLVARVLEAVARLRRYPSSGKRPPELSKTPYREIVSGPCRVFYRLGSGTVYVLHVMRAERLLRRYMLER
jgi:plasmid stabilization system protein ParE